METAITIKNLLSQDNIKKRFIEILGQKAQGFISSIINIVNSSDQLKKSDSQSILNAAVIAATLDLPIDTNLGFAAIIPYNCKVKDKNGKDMWLMKAQFQIMYKGFVQLAQRSGQFKTLNACPIYEGELISENRLTGEYDFDFASKKSEVIIGYAAYFKLINGFEKTIYWDINKVDAHGKRFSKSYQKNFGLWKDDFESMAIKTVLKYILSKFAPLSIDMQKAVKFDQSVVNENEITEG
ncbi:unnamed protein product, partial [marine sediment metagenome]